MVANTARKLPEMAPYSSPGARVIIHGYITKAEDPWSDPAPAQPGIHTQLAQTDT